MKATLKRAVEVAPRALNSSFVVTLLGGILLALVSAGLQNRASKSQRTEAERAEAAQRTERLAYEFANNFPMSVNLAYRFRVRKLWLDANQYGSQERFSDGRDYVETRNLYEALLERYLTNKPAASLCNQLLGNFQSSNVMTLAASLNEKVNQLVLATNEAQAKLAYTGASTDYQELTRVAFAELNSPKPP